MPFTSFQPLRHRNFALLWMGSAVSNIGTWMQTVAVGALVRSSGGRNFGTALVAAAAFLPMGLLSPVGGALADRLDRRLWLAIGNLVQAGLALVLTGLAATGHATPGVLTLVVLANGCVAAPTLPFQQAMIPDLVPKEDLLAAAALGSAQYNLGRVVGPALAGIVIAASSYTWAFAVNAVSFGAVIVALVFIRLPAHPVDHTAGLWARIKEGAAATRAEPGCRAAVVMVSMVALLAAPFIALIPARAGDLVDGAKAIGRVTGILTSAQGIGAVTGALLVAPLATRFGRRRVIQADIIGTCIALVLYAYAPSVATAAAALFLVGGLYIGVLSGLNTVVQLRAPAEFRGRVLSLYLVALGVIYPIGAVIEGAVADRVHLSNTTAAGAALLVVAVVALSVTRPQVLRALDGDEPAIVDQLPVDNPAVSPSVAAD